MFYWLTVFSDGGDFFNLFRYITFRREVHFLQHYFLDLYLVGH